MWAPVSTMTESATGMSESAPAHASPALAVEGAVPADDLDAGVAWHYGDPMAEQRALLAGRGVVDLSHRGVLILTGPDRLTWLDTLSTQWLRDLPPGRPAESLILSPHGHIEHALHVVDDGERTWITVEPGAGPGLRAHLEAMRFMLRVEIADVTGQWAVLGRHTPVDVPLTPTLRPDPPAPRDPPVWTDPWPGPVGDTTCYGPEREHLGQTWAWQEQLVPRADLLERLAGHRAGTWAAEALRIAAGRPRFGADTDHRTIPHELDWLRTAVHLHKGCYRGQETVARVHNLGRPPRRLVLLHLDGSAHLTPAPDTALTLPAGGRPVGRITSVARHYELGPIALAVVKRSLDPAATLHAGAVSAAQEAIIPS